MKKIITLILVLALVAALVVSFAACKKSESNEIKEVENNVKSDTTLLSESFGSPIAAGSIKIGLICLHDTSSTYDKNFIDAFHAAAEELGIPSGNVYIKTGIEENNDCYDAAVELVSNGCNIIFADSFGHETFLMQAAEEYPNVQFCHATGTNAHTAELKNFHNAFASIYEGRYLAGVVAGMKLNEMITAGTITAAQAVMGYVGAWPYAEVKSGYTSFYLGAKSVCPSVTMKVKFTNSWYDEPAERETANYLINQGCVLISQHADSMGAPSACEALGVPNVTYNVSTKAACGTTYLGGCRINWAPYYKYAISSVIAGKQIATDWSGTIATGSVELLEYGTAIADGTAAKVDEVKGKIKNGTIKVFDTANFTKGGAKLDTYNADVDSDENFTPDTQVIKGGVFLESYGRSAPYFDVDIDGISIVG